MAMEGEAEACSKKLASSSKPARRSSIRRVTLAPRLLDCGTERCSVPGVLVRINTLGRRQPIEGDI